MQCYKPYLLQSEGIFVPCGHCVACRIARSREWAVRCLHESEYWNDSVFLTLTYDKYHLPANREINKEELQRFFKRLRRTLDLNYDRRRIKYFACGEYGEVSGRCHYHAIVFGLSQSEPFYESVYDDKKIVKLSDWHNGNVMVGSVTYDSIRYVADYIGKAYNGEKADEYYNGMQPPFRLVSSGIGKRYCLDHEMEFRRDLCCYVRGIKMSLPRYYRTLLGLDKSLFMPMVLERERKWIEHVKKNGHSLLNKRGVDLVGHRLQTKIDLSKRLHLVKRDRIIEYMED